MKVTNFLNFIIQANEVNEPPMNHLDFTSDKIYLFYVFFFKVNISLILL